MAARPIDPKIAEAILIDWRVGQYSQKDLSDKYKVSKGLVNKICKGTEQDGKAIVTAGIQYNQALTKIDDRMVTAIEDTVKTQVQRLEWLNEKAIKNIEEAFAIPCENQQDIKARAASIKDAKEVLVGKSPDVAIQLNNQMSAPVQTTEEFKEIARSLVIDV